MKKYTVLCAALATAMIFTGCKSKESAYKQAYLKAKQQEEIQQANAATVSQNTQSTASVVPMEEKAANNTQVIDNGDNVTVRQETVSVVNGTGLKNFSVVVGSFSLKANAEGLQQTLKADGYNAQVVINSDVTPAMYRVIATTFETKSEAASSRAALMTKYPGAWLLYAK